MKISRYDVKIIILLIFISLLPLFLDVQMVRKSSHYFFLIHLLLIISSIIKTKRMISFMSPAILAIMYIEISFFLGAYAFSNGFVMRNTPNYENYLSWQYISNSTTYMLLCSTVVFILDSLYRRKILQLASSEVIREIRFPFILLPLLFLTSPFLFIPLDAAIFGGEGDLSMIPKSVTVLVVIYFLARCEIKLRILYYILILIFFSFISVHSKREAIFLIFPILLLEFMFNVKEIKFKVFFNLLLIIFLLLLLIIMMSIVRGYGNFNDATNLIAAIPFVLEYINSPEFLSALFNNIEVNYTYYHSMQALEYVQNDSGLIAGGVTLIKFIFILIPRTLWIDKPKSIIDLYTDYHDQSFRDIGGSWPINLYAELFWNFSFFGLIMLSLLFALFMWLYMRLIISLIKTNYVILSFGLFVFMNFITYMRGSGLDLYVVYSVISLVFVLVCYLFTFIIPLKSKRIDSKK